MDNNSVKQCVLMQHGLTLTAQTRKTGVCCYNSSDPSKYKTYDIDLQGCYACIEQEQNGITSYRQGANEIYGLDHSHRSPIVLDITPNRNCNLTCKICSLDHSSSWAKLKNIKIDKDYNIEVDDFKQMLLTHDLSYVKEINFSGGEPLLNNNIVKYVSALENRINFSDCTLRFSTNGTMYISDTVIKFFEKFKTVLIRFSLDDIESGHEYQRCPSKWSDWEDVWMRFLEHLPHNVIPTLNRTVGILNINRLHLLDSWHQQYSQTKYGDPIEVVDHFVFGKYSLNYLPKKLKDHILSAHGTESKAWKYVSNRPAVNDCRALQQAILDDDFLNDTNCKEFDLDLYRAIFQ